MRRKETGLVIGNGQMKVRQAVLGGRLYVDSLSDPFVFMTP